MGRATVAALLVLGVVGCGFHLPAGGPDDTAPDGSGNNGDSGSGATCLARWLAHDVSFTNIHRLDELSSAQTDRDPYITHDQLTVFFSSGRDGGDPNIYVASRATPADAFSTPALAGGMLSSSSEDTRVALTTDQLTVVIASARSGASGGMALFLGVRRFTTEDFTVMTSAPFSQFAAGEAQFDPELTGDGARLYYAPPGGAVQHIVVASRSGQAYDPPVDVPGVNDDLQNADPSLSPDERVIVFSSTRPAASGSFDLYYATRDSATGTFETPIRLDTLDSAGNDGDPMLTGDGCHLFFASDRQGSDYDLYSADVAP